MNKLVISLFTGLLLEGKLIPVDNTSEPVDFSTGNFFLVNNKKGIPAYTFAWED